jgi:hypothetical protein
MGLKVEKRHLQIMGLKFRKNIKKSVTFLFHLIMEK